MITSSEIRKFKDHLSLEDVTHKCNPYEYLQIL